MTTQIAPEPSQQRTRALQHLRLGAPECHHQLQASTQAEATTTYNLPQHTKEPDLLHRDAQVHPQ
jgi:hypothetical protein